MADELILVPGRAFHALRNSCLFRRSCFGEIEFDIREKRKTRQQLKKEQRGFDVLSASSGRGTSFSGLNTGPDGAILTHDEEDALARTGRGCYRCAALNA